MGTSMKEFQFVGCLGRHGPYSFFQSIKIGGRTLALTSFFPVKPWPDSAMLSIAEVQLLWTDKTEGFCSLKLYFLPENTPDGRKQQHGEDEVIALQDKVIIRALDLPSWLVKDSDWDWGLVTPSSYQLKSTTCVLTKSFLSDKFQKNDKSYDFAEPGSSRVVVLNYERYIRLRSVLKRLEGSSEMSSWLSHPLVLALGNINVGPGCKVLFTKETFDYPELEDHELLCNHLAPKLKGRPRKKNRKRNPSLGSESCESEISSSGSSKSDLPNKKINGVIMPVETIKVEETNILTVSSERVPPPIPCERVPPPIPCESVPPPIPCERVPPPISCERVLPPISCERVPPPISSPEIEMLQRAEIIERNENDAIVLPNCNGLEVIKIESNSMTKNGKIGMQMTDIISSSSPRKKSSVVEFSNDISPVKAGPDLDNKNDLDEKKITAEILGPALSELAEKLEKSNAIKILPVRSSVITKMDSISDINISRIPMKTDNPAMPASKALTFSVANLHIKPSNSSTRNNAKISWPKTSPPQRPASWYTTAKPEIDDSVKPVPPQVEITNLDQGKLNNFRVPQHYPYSVRRRNGEVFTSYNSSPFLPSKAQVYGDPSIHGKNREQLRPIKPPHPHPLNINSYSKRYNEEILDFSFKRPRLDNESKSSSNSTGSVIVNNLNGDSELLDLSIKSQHVNNFKHISDIPPPNAMNQMGVRLTSEVTLYPAGSRQAFVPNHNQFDSVVTPVLNTSKKTSSTSIDRHSTWSNQGSASAAGERTMFNNVNPAVWREPPIRTSNPLRHGLASSGLRNMHPQPRFGHPDPKLTVSNQVERLPQPGHVHGTAAKPVASKGILRHRENGRESHDAEIQQILENERMSHQASQHLLNSNFQRIDPNYMTLMNSRFINPMNLPPNHEAIEEWHRYHQMMRTWPFRANDHPK